MKSKYQYPWLKVVEINESSMLCTSGEDDKTKPMQVELNDYSTYEDTHRDPSSGVDWDGVGTGSDF